MSRICARTSAAPSSTRICWQSWPAIKKNAPQGDGHPILLIPGFTANDKTTTPLCEALKEKGYDAHTWGGGRNLGLTNKKAEHLCQTLEKLYKDNGNREVTLIGHSLGLSHARELAREFPHLVRDVITVGSPFGVGMATDKKSVLPPVRALIEFINGKRISLKDEDTAKRLLTPPPSEPGATHIPEVADITPEIMGMAGDAASEMSRGGMKTKVAAARIATDGGCNMAIANGRTLHPLRALEEGARCTWFTARTTPVASRKRWISGSLKTMGSITVDDGAVNALRHGRSLLPAGITTVEGRFERGDALSILDEQGVEIARGLSAYSSEDARRIKGHNSSEIEELLGFAGRAEMVHRDDLVMMKA